MFFVTWWIERRAVIRRVPEQTSTRATLATLAANALSYILLFLAIAWLPYFRDLDRMNYRSDMSEALLMSTPWREKVDQYWRKNKRFPERGADIGLTESQEGRRVRAVALETGGRIVILLKFPGDPEFSGMRLIYEPRVEGDALRWQCRSPDMPQKYLPVTCRDSVAEVK